LYPPNPAVSGEVEPDLPYQPKKQYELIVTGQKLNFLRMSDDNPKDISAFLRYLRKRYFEMSPFLWEHGFSCQIVSGAPE